MNEGAHVRSIDAIRDFRLALCNFRDGASQALASVDSEIQRTLDWLGHDQVTYWKEEIRRCEDRVNEAKIDLNRCLIAKTAGGEAPACSDQKVALNRAKARLGEAEGKLNKVRQWCQIIEQEISEYRGPSQHLANTIETTLPKGLTVLDRKVVQLEAYVVQAPSQADTSLPSSSAATGSYEAEPLRKKVVPQPASESPVGGSSA